MRHAAALAATVVLAACSQPAPAPVAPPAPTAAPAPVASAPPPVDAARPAPDAAKVVVTVATLGSFQGGAFSSITGPGPGSDVGGQLGDFPSGEGTSLGAAGGGGTGWGTIGTGRSGTVAGGSTSGGGGRATTVVKMTLGKATQAGDLDPEIVQRYMKRNASKFRYCYEKALLANPALAGEVTATFLIDGSGNVQASTATGVSDDVSSCVAGVIKSIEFPKPTGSSVQVTYPITYAPR